MRSLMGIQGRHYVVQAMIDKERAVGASKSLNQNIKEIRKIMDGKHLPFTGDLRDKFRKAIRKAIIESSEKYYKIGYRRGVHTVYEQIRNRKAISFPVRKSMKVSFIPNEVQKEIKLEAHRPMRKRLLKR